MPTIKLTDEEKVEVNPIEEPQTTLTESSFDNAVNDLDIEELTEQEQIYSKEEINDPEAIDVTIADQETPIVVLFGPPACGKTMTMIRLAEFLTDKRRGYNVQPVRSFRSTYDHNYATYCDKFNQMLNSPWAAEKSLGLNFMLLKVSKGGRPIVQILEAPGEHYFDPKDLNEPKNTFISYIQKVINVPNRKIWLYMTEPNWKDQNDRARYAQKVDRMKRGTSQKDKSILVFNKVNDMQELFISMEEVNQKSAEKHIDNMYPGMFECFKNTNPLTSLWKPYACTFVPFATGTYTQLTIEGKARKKYTQGPDIFPQTLWNEILKAIGLPKIN